MARVSSRDRMKNEVNAGSMADIAFLLLIFFLVTTTIVEDKGILVKLPPWSEEDVDVKLNTRNIYSVLVNANNQLLVRGELMDIRVLKDKTKEFITNPTKREDLPLDPKKAVVSLKNDRGTQYGTYLEVYNELRAAYNEVWDEESKKRYGGKGYADINKAQQKSIRTDYPLIISEAEATSFGEEN